ncbi:hypothetical protein TR13x_09615 [Caloranaerobacter sp. TR13]|uniref:hypothetical protein n=1 Tax=Caloranaerobacter TaxID=171003 RepID=UPI0006D3F66F|nr:MULTISPECIES: hypothetical protein [Caloranaerobacter]KPU26527.1 hypothetical protein TR13x_09615 [Caloranaerobacter sp. TR13]
MSTNRDYNKNRSGLEYQRKIDIYKKDDEIESMLVDKTAYGEWMATTFGWAGFEEQNRAVNRIEDITKY